MSTRLPAGSVAAARRVTGSCRDFTLDGVKIRVVCQGNLEIGLELDTQVGLLAIFHIYVIYLLIFIVLGKKKKKKKKKNIQLDNIQTLVGSSIQRKLPEKRARGITAEE